MTTSNKNLVAAQIGGRRFVSSCAMLLLVLLATLPVFCWLGYVADGASGLKVVAVAGMACGVGALSALFVSGMFQGANAINGVLLGMLFRMSPPFAVVFASTRSDLTVSTNVLAIVVACYVLTLFAETLISIRLVLPRQVSTGAH